MVDYQHNSDDEKQTVMIHPRDVTCPVLNEKYTEQNYPVTLPCGHTLSIEGFRLIKKRECICPSCRSAFSGGYIPQKSVLWGNIAHQVRNRKKKIYCHNHPKDEARGICFIDKIFLCEDCLLEDEHPKEHKVTFKKLNTYLQNKKDALEEQYTKVKEDRVDDSSEMASSVGSPKRQHSHQEYISTHGPLLPSSLRFGLDDSDLNEINEDEGTGERIIPSRRPPLVFCDGGWAYPFFLPLQYSVNVLSLIDYVLLAKDSLNKVTQTAFD